MSRRAHTLLDAATIILYCVAIFFISSRPLTGKLFFYFPGYDKVVHFILYAGLGMVACRFLANDLRLTSAAAMVFAAVFTAAYGLTDEIHQLYVPGRSMEFLDLAADTAGAVAAVLFWYVFMSPWCRSAASVRLPTERLQNDVPL